jgi:GntR family transcriptional regulator
MRLCQHSAHTVSLLCWYSCVREMGGGLDLRIDRDGDVPLGAQLAGRIRAAVESGPLRPGDRLPSVRELAEAARVNVNTARTVYARLESEGVVRSEHGRGTFVATGTPAGEVAVRRDLRRQIAQLEAALVRLPPPPEPTEPSQPARAALLSTADLEGIRDRLLERLDQLDLQRAEVMQQLEELGAEQRAPDAVSGAHAARRSTPSLAGARIRWVGA